MNKDKRAILIGMILGDGCLKSKTRDYVEFAIEHSEKQLRYLQWKASKLHSILGGKPFKIHVEHHTLNNGITYEGFRISRQHKYFKLLKRWIYPNNIKTYTRKILDKLNLEGIAYWYMDDGGLVITKNVANEISSFQIRLYTYCSLKEAEEIQRYFKEVWNIEFKIHKHTYKEQYTLRANTTESNKFFALIYKYKAPSMEYKFLEPRARSTHLSEDIV